MIQKDIEKYADILCYKGKYCDEHIKIKKIVNKKNVRDPNFQTTGYGDWDSGIDVYYYDYEIMLSNQELVYRSTNYNYNDCITKKPVFTEVFREGKWINYLFKIGKIKEERMIKLEERRNLAKKRAEMEKERIEKLRYTPIDDSDIFKNSL